MRGAPAKSKEPARHTRSGVAGKMVAGTTAGASGRPKRASLKPKPKAKPVKKQAPAAPVEKKPAKQTKTVTSNKKSSNIKPKESVKAQREKEKVKTVKEEINPEVIVIKLSKNQRNKKKTEPAKMGVASGKVGKRKGKTCQIKKETLKKASKTEKDDDLVLHWLTVERKVIPTPKAETKEKEKPVKKGKVEKKKNDKEEKKEKIEKIKKEPKEDKKPKDSKKVQKVEKKTKDVGKDEKNDTKEEKKDIREEKKESKEEKKEIKEEKIIKLEKIIKEEKLTPEEKKKIAKPKSKSKERKEPKKVEVPKIKQEPEAEKVKITKTKVKLEKISPITVQEDNMENPGSPVHFPSHSRNPSPVKVKTEKTKKPVKPPVVKKEKPVKKRAGRKPAIKIKEEPVFMEKRHREASLNALAKVHCLYENESRGAMNEILDKSIIKRKEDIKVEKADSPEPNDDEEQEVEEKPSRTLRSAPGMRGAGRHWDILNMSTSSSSDDEAEKQEESSQNEGEEAEEEEPPPPQPQEKKVRKRRKRTELMMDLKDMVVRKRMASLNASAMMAASYSVEKRGSGDKRRSGRSTEESTSSAVGDSSDDEVIVSGSKKVAVIVNQDADLTITGLYTTRSTRHEGYCSIAGMQYRISSTSHTQTEATAVSTETVIHTTDHVSVSHSESGGSVDAGGTSSPGGSCKSYTPLGALSSMQPPGQGRPCGSSAFSAPPYHPHPQDLHDYGEDTVETKYSARERTQSFIGYYQPAGPLISHGGGPTSTSGGGSGSKNATPEPPYPPPHPYSAYPPAYDYPGYYGRGYRRPWASTSQMMTDYLEPTYPPPNPHYYYPAPPAPPPPPTAPPVCYASPVRLPFIDQPFQCPCPMQSSCPKNVHTGPLTGASKRSEPEAQTTELTTLLPVALALPPEPSGASPGPPSPARGSAGMPPPASPAPSTARNNRWSPPDAGLIKPATSPPPPITVVESSPPPDTTPPPEAPTAPCKRRNKRAASDASEVVRKRKKSSVSAARQNKNKGSKTLIPEKIEDKNDNNNISNHNNNITSICKKPAELPLRRTPSLRWSNGWSWEGEPYTAKVFLTTEDPGAMRKCYPAMRHREGDVIRPRDCILLRSSGPRKALPFVAKVSAMWENPDDGEMMVSVLWYYRPEHTEQGRTPDQPVDEIFASRHKDTNSVACIEDKCYVLTYYEYCRYRKSLLAGGRKINTVVPPPAEGYPRADQLPPGQVASELVFFCRQVYDFRQKKILKKPPSQPAASRT